MIGLMRAARRTSGVMVAVLTIVALLRTFGATVSAADRAGLPSREWASGISGRVLIGPTCPVQRIGETCVRPYQGTIAIHRGRTKRLIARVRSSPSGTFRVGLAPGRYELVPQAGRAFASSSARTVTVRSDRYTSVVISFDSGIR